jgi:hypothetical protein
LPNGKALFLGGTGATVYYTPSGNTNRGTWSPGPSAPTGFAPQDAPAAMMVNGKILCAMGSITNHQPIYFYEFNPNATGALVFVPAPAPNGSSDNTTISDHSYMLDLPDGRVLYSDTGSQLYEYQPDPGQVAAGKPGITTIRPSGRLLAYHLVGTNLNGISAGAAYGDDAQMDSNYPLVRLNDNNGNFYYARTYNRSSTGVQTGTAAVSTEFVLPARITPGTYSLVAVANGISSDPVSFTYPPAVWVDFNYTGMTQTGAFQAPFPTLAQGVSAVSTGGIISIKPGTSAETMTINKAMTIIAPGGAATIGR